MVKKYPEDGPDFQRALEQRRREIDVDRLVQMVGIERRDLERRRADSEKALRRAKDTLARTQHISDEYAARVWAKARAHLAKRDYAHDWVGI